MTGEKPKIARLPADAGDVCNTCTDVNRAAELLGHAPATNLAEVLRGESSWVGGWKGAPIRLADWSVESVAKDIAKRPVLAHAPVVRFSVKGASSMEWRARESGVEQADCQVARA